MNYLDLLPNDVMKIIDREIQNINIVKRRIEIKKIKKMNRDQKRIAEHKIDLYKKFAILYNKYIVYQQNKKYSQRVDDHYEHTQKLFNDILKRYGELLLYSEQCILEVMNHI